MNLALHGVRLRLEAFTLALDLTLAARVTAIFGPSGSGKTTLLEIVAGLRRPDSGRVMLGSTCLTDCARSTFAPPEKRGIGYVPQDDALFPHLSVRENLLYGTRSASRSNPELSFEHVAGTLEITPLLERRVTTLSGGERQRIALGRALLAAPRLLLLDEPLGRLDAPLKDRLLPYLRRVREEFTLPIVLVTHSADEVVALGDEAVVLERGHVARHGPVRELFRVTSRLHYELAPPGNISG